MALTTYLGIKDAIESWSHRNDVASRLDDFIDLAEAEMYKYLRTRDMEDRSNLSITTRYATLPTGFLEARRLRVISGGNSYDLLYSTPESLEIVAESGRPRLFTVTSQIEFDRTPDSSYTVEVQYYKTLTALSQAAPTNAILTRFPDIYLNGALWALYQWALQEDKSEFYYAKFMKAIQGANRSDRKGRQGPAPAMRYGGATP
jgi:hypothetical protein